MVEIPKSDDEINDSIRQQGSDYDIEKVTDGVNRFLSNFDISASYRQVQEVISQLEQIQGLPVRIPDFLDNLVIHHISSNPSPRSKQTD
jgi:hypothetical protein